MKRVCFILFFFLVSYSLELRAQITISNVARKDWIIAVDPINNCGIGNGDNGYFVFAETSNSFDSYFYLYLGKEKSSAIQSLRDIISLVESIGSQVIEFQSWNGDCFSANAVHRGLRLKSEKTAGYVYLHEYLLGYLLRRLELPMEEHWNSVHEAITALGQIDKVAKFVWKWGQAYFYRVGETSIYLGSSEEEAYITLSEFSAYISDNQMWPIIIINSFTVAEAKNDVELGARLARLSLRRNEEVEARIPLYLLYLNSSKTALKKK